MKKGEKTDNVSYEGRSSISSPPSLPTPPHKPALLAWVNRHSRGGGGKEKKVKESS